MANKCTLLSSVSVWEEEKKSNINIPIRPILLPAIGHLEPLCDSKCPKNNWWPLTCLPAPSLSVSASFVLTVFVSS